MTIDPSLIWNIVGFFILIGLSGAFSLTETAIFSLTRSQIDELAENKDAASRRLSRLLSDPRRILIVLLTGNTFVNILAATLAALVTTRLLKGSPIAWLVFAIQVMAVTLILLIGGEVLPKLTAIHSPLRWSMRMSAPLVAMTWILSPIVRLLLPFTDFVARTFGIERRRLFISEDEIKTLVEVGEEHGVLEKTEKEMIHSIFEFGETTIREIMVPRTDVVCLDVTSSVDQILETVQSSQHTRIPIYEGSIDNIIGILHTKDLLAHYPLDHSFDLRSVLRKPIFVPETKLIHEVLKQFQEQRIHMTIAVDEYGGTAGLVTLEDILEEIVGEIQDEHDVEKPLWFRIDERTVIADARLDVETVNQVLGGDVIPTDQDFETLGGFILSELGDFPQVNTSVEYHNYEFVVEEVSDHRLGKVRIVRREALTDSSA